MTSLLVQPVIGSSLFANVNLHQLTIRLQPLPSRRQNRSNVAAYARGKAQRASVAVEPAPVATVPAISSKHMAIGLGVIVAAVLYLGNKFKKGGFMYEKRALPSRSQMNDVLEGATADSNSKEYRMALARTRQAVAVHKAIGFMNTGNAPRAMVELRRALHENSACRSPVLSNQWTKVELQGLYGLHLQNAPVPADFATLLQLRTMLDLEFDDAEKIEREIMEQGSAYSI